MANTSAHDTQERAHPTPGRQGRPGTFLAQVTAELRKVVRPTRRELITYTIVVLVFVLVIMGYVVGLDQVFTRIVDVVFAA